MHEHDLYLDMTRIRYLQVCINLLSFCSSGPQLVIPVITNHLYISGLRQSMLLYQIIFFEAKLLVIICVFISPQR